MRWIVHCGIWLARRQQQSLADLIGITLPETVITAQTVVIGTPDQMANSASTLWQAGAKLLKVKLDNHLISERMVAIRTAVPDATLIVDANESLACRRVGGALPAIGGFRRCDA